MVLFLLATQAQVTRTASFIANDPAVYPCSGDVTLTLSGNTITVDFASNFQTVQGLTLEVFLTKTKNLNMATDVKISTTPLDFGTATNSPIIGPRTFTVPAGVDAFEFNNVIIECTSIMELWGHANLCEPSENFTAGPLPSDMYEAVQNITCSTNLLMNSVISMEAMDRIELLNGFDVSSNTDYLANVGPSLGCIIEN